MVTEEKVTLTLAKRLAAFLPCTTDLWKFELDRDDLVYPAEEMCKEQSIQEIIWVLLKALGFIREAEHKSLKNLQLGNMIKRNPLF